MSLPIELRVLCHQLSSTPTAQLPQTTPILLHNALRCQEILSAEGQSSKKDAPEGSVLVHKLKTQISTLLYGKSADGRFAAVVLVKTIVDVGGWEVLRGVEPWVRGMLSLLGKPDPITTKRLCILALTDIYLSTRQYQTLVREIVTPTLPTYVTSCLNLISPNSPGRILDVSYSLLEVIFESISALIPWYPTIFRPFARQMRLVVRPYLAPTLCDRRFVCLSLSRSARNLAVILHQTAAKNTGGEEWGRAVQELVTEIHSTTDQVFRAVIEDWESSSGYVSQTVDTSQRAQSKENARDGLPAWDGIDAGIERVVGLLGLLEEHFMHPTPFAVSIPLEVILDLLVRLTSVVPPVNAKGSSDHAGMRLNPAIERNEREALWAGIRHVHIASIEVYCILVERLQHNFASMAERCLSQIFWLYSESLDESFRSVIYQLTSKVLPMCGLGLPKQSIALMAPIIRACCTDLRTVDDTWRPSLLGERGKGLSNGSSVNVDTFLQSRLNASTVVEKSRNLLEAATELLPLFITSLPQEHLQTSLRADIDRTAILSRHKEAMLASVLTPFTGKNGKCLPSILPHLCREFGGDPAVEALLRPRLPVLPQIQPSVEDDDMSDEALPEPEDMMEDTDAADTMSLHAAVGGKNNLTSADFKLSTDEQRDVGPRVQAPRDYWGPETAIKESTADGQPPQITAAAQEPSHVPPNVPHRPEEAQIRASTAAEEDDSDESVHLAMELSDSEDESVS